MNIIEKFILKKAISILEKHNKTTVRTERNVFQLMSFEFHEWCYDLTKGYKLFREQNNLHTHNSSYETPQSNIATSKSAKADFS